MKSIIACLAAAALCGCQTPSRQKSGTEIVDIDSFSEESGGIGSYEIRTVASEMAPRILAIPEVSGADAPVRVYIERMSNKSSYPMDMAIFMTRLRVELSRYGAGKVRFFGQGKEAQAARSTISREQADEDRDAAIEEVARSIAGLRQMQSAEKPPVVAVLPALNANLVNLNADSFIAMLRAKISEAAKGGIALKMPGETEGADYFLTGQFIAESTKTEGMINLADYIALIDEKIRAGQPLSNLESIAALSVKSKGDGSMDASAHDSQRRDSMGFQAEGNISSEMTVKQASTSPVLAGAESGLRSNPNVPKKLNVILLDAATRASVFEKMFDIERDPSAKNNFSKADYTLGGEVASLSKRVNGREVAYLLITVHLLDTAANEIVWEDAFEIKKASSLGAVY